MKNIKYTMNVLENKWCELVFGKYVLKMTLYKIIKIIVAAAIVSPA